MAGWLVLFLGAVFAGVGFGYRWGWLDAYEKGRRDARPASIGRHSAQLSKVVFEAGHYRKRD